MTAAGELFDPGAQAERTALAWQRTGLSTAAVGLLLVHAHPVGHLLPPWPGLLLVTAGAVLAAVVSPVRYLRIDRTVRAGGGPSSSGTVPAITLVVLLCILGVGAILVKA